MGEIKMNIIEVTRQITRLKNLLSLPTTDVSWSKYNSAEDAIKDLDDIEKGLKELDENSVDRLYILLAPTSSLQEISINSGWSQEFLDIAIVLEKAIGK